MHNTDQIICRMCHALFTWNHSLMSISSLVCPEVPGTLHLSFDHLFLTDGIARITYYRVTFCSSIKNRQILPKIIIHRLEEKLVVWSV